MTIAVCSWSLRPEDPQGLVASLRRVGIDSVQLALCPLVDDPDRWRDVVSLLRDAGVEIVSGMMATRGEDYSSLEAIARTGGLRQDDRWPDNRRLAERVAAIAGDASIDLVTFHAGFMPEPDELDADATRLRAAMIERLRHVADCFADRGVAVALETGQESAETLIAFLDLLDRPHVGVNFDPANMILYGKGDPVEAARTLAPRIAQVHVKDALPTDVPGTWGREMPVGQGAVPWPAFLDVVTSLEPRPALVIEREAGQDRTDDILAARSLLAGHAGAGS